MNSIQFRLTIRLVIGVLLVSVLGCLAVYLVFRESLIRQFDEGLRADAQSIMLLFTRDHDGHYEFNSPPDVDRLFRHGHHPDFFCIRRMDGAVAIKSHALGHAPCPGAEFSTGYEGVHKVLVQGRHHGGERLRAIFLDFVPASEGQNLAAERFQIIVAAERQDVDHLLEQLLKALIFVAFAAGAATALLVVWTVRRDLGPLRSLAAEAGQIGEGELDRRFSLETVPMELLPIHRALNDLLARIEGAWNRERRFTADVAHELRTPVAELRSLCEVALAAGDPKATVEALNDAREIGAQMEALINALLALRRSEERKPSVRTDVVVIAKEAWLSAEPVATQRGLTMIWQTPPQSEVLCDRTMLLAALRNLFENAATYTQIGGIVACTVSSETISVRNQPHGLSPDDIPHLIEPFWRKDLARTSGAHAGLGLALADAYCRSFGGSLHIHLEEGWVCFDVVFPK